MIGSWHINMNDEQETEDRAKKVKLERDQELEDIKILLKNPAGLRFFKRLFDEGKMFRTTFTGNSQTYFLEGRRDLALKFFHDILEVDPGAIAGLTSDKPSKLGR